MVLLVFDNSLAFESGFKIPERITAKKILTVLNKSDLPSRLDTDDLPKMLSEEVQISAKLSTGIEKLVEKIRKITGVEGFDIKDAVCITSRQQELLKEITGTKTKDEAVSVIKQLLKGQVQ